jgi:hypothetical protein
LIERLYASSHNKVFLNVSACKIMRLLWSYLLYVLSFECHHYCFTFMRSNCKICCRFTSSDKEIGCYILNKYWMRQQVILLFDFVSIINIEVFYS